MGLKALNDLFGLVATCAVTASLTLGLPVSFYDDEDPSKFDLLVHSSTHDLAVRA